MRLYILSYDLRYFSSFLGSLLLKPCGCFSPYNIESFCPFPCLIVAFLGSFVHKACPLHALNELSFSLISILLLSSIHNIIVFTLFLYFSFLRTGFCNLLIFSLTNKFPSLPLFHQSPSLSFSRGNFRPSHRFQSVFSHAAFPFYYSSLFLFDLIFIHGNTVKSCLQLTFFLPPKDCISFREVKKAVIPFQV